MRLKSVLTMEILANISNWVIGAKTNRPRFIADEFDRETAGKTLQGCDFESMTAQLV